MADSSMSVLQLQYSAFISHLRHKTMFCLQLCSFFLCFYGNRSVSLFVMTENARLANQDASLPRLQRVDCDTVSVDFCDVLVAGEVTRLCLLQDFIFFILES